MKKPAGILFATAVFCLLLSGMAGLVYEVAWARYLALFLGHTSYAVVAVLVAFMGGLALGNAWLGKLADRSRRPLALYAWLEIGIGLYALLFPFHYDLCRAAFVGLARGLPPGSFGMLFLKFVFSLLTILLPTVLMGGTLPVLTKLVTRSLGELRERVAALYFINSAGAVFGIIIADFWWVPSIGLEATVWAGAALNLLVGAVALFVSGWLREGQPGSALNEPEPVRTSAPEPEEQFAPSDLRLAIIGIGLSGFVAMLYEVVWTRLLALALGSSTHAFSIMLITFITGIAAGAAVIYRWKRLRRTMEAFAWAEIALAATLFVSMFYYDRLPYWFMKLAGFLVRKPESYPLYEFLQASICFAVMFAPALCLGMTLPMVSRIATAELARTGRSVGTVFSINTLGTVLGAAVTGLWLMPWLGMPRTLALGIAVNALVGVVVLFRNNRPARRLAFQVSPVLAALMVWLAGFYFNDTWQSLFTAGLWRRPGVLETFQEFRADELSREILYYRDGAGSTVSVNTWKVGTNEHLSLKVNGKPDASTTSDMGTQLLSGHIPLLLHPPSRQALVIGLGSGVTCGAVLRHPTIEHLDGVEISPEVVDAARLFGPHNDHVLDNPRMHMWVEDAKTFLQTTSKRYDVIISEPSNPWMAGVSGVFSREYYETCAGRLQTNGLMAQWVQVYETSNEALQMVFATFSAVFPYMSVWQGSPGDLILIGSLQPVRVDFAELDKRFREPAVKSDLERIDMLRLPVFLAREIISHHNAPFVVPSDAVQHSDYYPALEYVAEKAFFVRGGTDLYAIFDESSLTRPTTLLSEYLKMRRLTEIDFKAFALFYDTQRLPEQNVHRTLLDRWQQDFPESLLPVEFSAKLGDPRPIGELEMLNMKARRDQIFQVAEQEPELLRLYARFLMQSYRAHRSVFYMPPTSDLEAALKRLLEVDQQNRRVHTLRLAEIAWDRGEDAACLELGRAAFDPKSAGGPVKFDLDLTAPGRVLARMIESLWRSNRLAEAWILCQDAQRSGYVGETAKTKDPWLEMTFRKVERAAGDTNHTSQ